MESISELLQIEADAILHKPFILPKHDDIKIYPLTIGQMIEINPYLIALQEKDDSKKITGIISKKDFSEALKVVTEYIPIMTKIIDVIIGKGKAEKLTPDEVLMTFTAIKSRMQTTSFLNSIIIAMKMSPTKKEGIIASKKYLISRISSLPLSKHST